MRRFAIAGGLALVAAVALLSLEVEVQLRSNDAAARTPGPFWSEAEGEGSVERPDSFADLAERLSPAVVNIKTEAKRPDLFEEFLGRPPGQRRRREGSGTGFVISADGYVVTNNHVVENADRITAAFVDGRELDAEVVGQDPKTDLALLKLDANESLPVAPLGDSDAVRVGDWVMAIGNPFGLEHTVTVGILSARGRVINAGPYDDFLQTDASINPGNSGGPLIDMRGRVVGINTAINAAGQGIGFAIPINMAKGLLPQLKEYGSVTRGWLGVKIQRVTPALADSFELDGTRGALVAEVFPDTPAAAAKLERGDVIVEFNGEDISSYDDLPRRVAATPPGSDVEIVVIRDGKRKRLGAKLVEMESEPIRPVSRQSSKSQDWGFEAHQLTSEMAERLGLEGATRGVIVIEVEAGSPADEAGLARNDVILEANKREIEDLEDLEKALEEAGDKIALLIRRGDGSLWIAIEQL